MPLDTLNSPSNYTGRMAAADRYDPEEFAESRENYRQNRARTASFEALMRRLEPPDMQRQRERVANIEDVNDDMYDLHFREPERTEIRGRLKRRQGDLDAVAEQNRYFEQEPMRRDKEAASMRALRSRYTDPAMIKADADYRKELERGRSARDVAGITGGSRERTEATRQFGDVTGDQVITGDREAGVSGRAELGARMGGAKTAEIGGPRGLQAYAQANGISLDEAIQQAEALGYQVVD